MKTYELQLWDRHCDAGCETIDARNDRKAKAAARRWAAAGDYDHPGTVRVTVTREGESEPFFDETVAVG